jgi:phospholipid/cholesterol/gamma-HCH transport system substrate-binding protein
MDKARLELKVGVFVFVSLLLLAALLVSFSKGVTRFARTYDLKLRTSDVGGIKTGASVLMAGYPIGNVSHLALSSNGESVVLTLQIKQEHGVRTNAIFVIEQSGFLGDQFVAIYPDLDRTARFFKPGEEATCPPPFNLQQTARDASGFIKRLDETARKLDAAIADIRRLVLNEATLVQVSNTLSSLRMASGRAVTTVDNVNALIETNAPLISASVSNLAFFSAQLSQFSGSLNTLLATNADEITTTLQSVEASAALLKQLLEDLRAGKGPAGRLLADEQMAANMAQIAQNLSVTTSNLNRFGLWRILWKPKGAETNRPPAVPALGPKNPFR